MNPKALHLSKNLNFWALGNIFVISFPFPVIFASFLWICKTFIMFVLFSIDWRPKTLYCKEINKDLTIYRLTCESEKSAPGELDKNVSQPVSVSGKLLYFWKTLFSYHITTSPLINAYVSPKTQLQAINLNFRALDNVISWMFAVTSYKTE